LTSSTVSPVAGTRPSPRRCRAATTGVRMNVSSTASASGISTLWPQYRIATISTTLPSIVKTRCDRGGESFTKGSTSPKGGETGPNPPLAALRPFAKPQAADVSDWRPAHRSTEERQHRQDQEDEEEDPRGIRRHARDAEEAEQRRNQADDQEQ